MRDSIFLFCFKALGKMGAYQEEFELLTNESSHSWVNMIREGGTTCFEAWEKIRNGIPVFAIPGLVLRSLFCLKIFFGLPHPF